MFRNLIILIFIAIALAMLRALVMSVTGAVKKVMRDPGSRQGSQASDSAANGGGQKAGRLVKDPISNTYIDERMAIKEEIDGKTYYFESPQNREAFLKKARA